MEMFAFFFFFFILSLWNPVYFTLIEHFGSDWPHLVLKSHLWLAVIAAGTAQVYTTLIPINRGTVPQGPGLTRLSASQLVVWRAMSLQTPCSLSPGSGASLPEKNFPL